MASWTKKMRWYLSFVYSWDACYIYVGFIIQQLQQFSAENGGISKIKIRDVSLTNIWSMNFFSLVVMIIGGRLPTRISIFGIHSVGTELWAETRVETNLDAKSWFQVLVTSPPDLWTDRPCSRCWKEI